MTKGDFYRELPALVHTKSYQERRIYHFPKTPKRAMKYRAETP